MKFNTAKHCYLCGNTALGKECYDCFTASQYLLKPWGHTPRAGAKYADSQIMYDEGSDMFVPRPKDTPNLAPKRSQVRFIAKRGSLGSFG